MKDNKPLILAVVKQDALHEAIQHHADDFEVLWSIFSSPPENVPNRDVTITAVADLHPALIIAEMEASGQITSSDWLPRIRTDPATRRIPVIAIADGEAAQQAARLTGIGTVVTSREFLDALPALLTQNAKVFTRAAELQTQCEGTLPPQVIHGLDEFNRREFFECHETLEAAWNAETGPARELYRAILQVGLAYYQIQRRNYNGARKMFLRAIQWFAPLPDFCQGIHVATLRADAAAARAHLEALGADRIAEFDDALLKPVIYDH